MNIFTLNLIYYLLDISIFLFIVCTFLYSKNWSKSGSAHKTLAVYFGFIAILQLTIRLFFDFSKNNWIISNIFLIGEFAISSFLFFILLKRKIFRNIIKIIVCFFVTITIIQYADDYMIFFKINALSSSIVSISIIL